MNPCGSDHATARSVWTAPIYRRSFIARHKCGAQAAAVQALRKLHSLLVIFVLAAGVPNAGFTQLAIVTNREPHRIFSGNAKIIPVVIHHAGSQSFNGEIRAQLWQISAVTAVKLGEPMAKIFQSLPSQTVQESVSLDFPFVKAETKFLIEWLADTNRVIGQTEVLVFPPNLLTELKVLFHGENLGVLDANGALKPSLKKNGIEFLDLEEMALEDFSGKLAILGPFQSQAQMREGLAQAIQQIARKGVAVVWIQPPPNPRDEIQPSFYIVPEGKGAVVVVQPDLVANFAENPKSQLNLIYFCKLALHPVPPALPNLSLQP